MEKLTIYLLIILILILIFGYMTGSVEHMIGSLTDNIGGKNIYFRTNMNGKDLYLVGVDTNSCGITNTERSVDTVIKFVLMEGKNFKKEIDSANSGIIAKAINPCFNIHKTGYNKDMDNLLQSINITDYLIIYNYIWLKPLCVKENRLTCLTISEQFEITQTGKYTGNGLLNCSLEDTGGNDGSFYMKFGTKFVGYSDDKCANYLTIVLYDDVKDTRILKFNTGTIIAV